MSRVSGRFVLPSLLLVLAAAVPVWVLRATDHRHDDCANPERLLEARRIEGTGRSVELSNRYGPAQFQWTEGRIHDSEGRRLPLRFRIIRSFEPSTLYAAPAQYFFHYPTPGDPTVLRWVEAGGERLPVHRRIETSTNAPVLLQYMYVFGGEPVTHPFPAGLGAAFRQLRLGRMPVTLFVTFGVNERSTTEAFMRVADDWLVSAWRHYDAACNGAGQQARYGLPSPSGRNSLR